MNFSCFAREIKENAKVIEEFDGKDYYGEIGFGLK